MNPIRATAQLALHTLVVPVERNVGLLRELATAGRALDRHEIAATTESAFHMLPICIATESTHLSACRVPERADASRRVVELALPSNLCASLGSDETQQDHAQTSDERTDCHGGEEANRKLTTK